MMSGGEEGVSGSRNSSEGDGTFSSEQVKKHSTREDLWLTIQGNVYNLTEFIEQHPGGPEVLLEQAGMDATTAFDDIAHSDHARELREKFKIGRLSTDCNRKEGTEASKLTTTGTLPKEKAPCSSSCCFSSQTTLISLAFGGAIVAGLVAYNFTR